jgi:ubiquitin-conjugating enzyme E2 J1
MAKESRSWKCNSCGASNEKILKQCAEAAEALGVKADVEIPKELKMGWKDEMRGAKKEADGADDGESAELAEGFVQTVPIPEPQNQTPPPPSPVSVRTYPPARPVQGVPQPTATIAAPHTALAVQGRRSAGDGVPSWVDKAIGGLFLCLLVMVLKIVLGL